MWTVIGAAFFAAYLTGGVAFGFAGGRIVWRMLRDPHSPAWIREEWRIILVIAFVYLLIWPGAALIYYLFSALFRRHPSETMEALTMGARQAMGEDVSDPVEVVRLPAMDETLPPGTERFYDIYAWQASVDPDGVVLIMARAMDGTEIWVGRSPSQGYEVFVQGPHEPDGRRYRGGVGSPAHQRYQVFRTTYERLFGPLAEP